MNPHLKIVPKEETPAERYKRAQSEASGALSEVLGDAFAAGDDLVARLKEVADLTKKSHAALEDAARKTADLLTAHLLNLQDLAGKR